MLIYMMKKINDLLNRNPVVRNSNRESKITNQ